MVADTAHVSYRGTEYEFALLDECSVSDHLRQTKEFYELDFLEGLSSMLEPSTLVLDVGAHIGNHTVYFAGVLGFQVQAYEPNPEAFELLERNIHRNGLDDKVTCVPVALSSEDGQVSMTRAVEDDAGTMAVAEQTESGNAIRVRTQRLDDLELPDPSAVFIKLDVEGHEPEVIRGGKLFLEKHAPDISVEIQDLDALDEILELLGGDYVPRDVFNATPTVLLRPHNAPTPDERQEHLVRYAIRNALDYSRRRNWYVAEKKRAERLRGEAESLRSKVADVQLQTRILEAMGPWLEESQLGDWVGWLQRLKERIPAVAGAEIRALIVRIGGAPIPASVVSVMMAAVDLVDCDAESGQPKRFRRFLDGRCVLDLTEKFGLGALGAARVSLLVEDANDELGSIGTAALIGGEAAPRLEEAFRNFLDCPYLVISHDATYQFSRLGVLTGAARVFLSDSDQMEAWSRSQIIPAAVIDASPLSIASELVSVSTDSPLQIERHDEPSSDADSRVLIVSYYAPPATPVSVQRLAYWHRKLPEIASERGVQMDVTWLTATFRASALPNIAVVPDRGPHETSGRWFELYTRARDLGLDAMGISWSQYVELSLDSLDGPYSTVVISGNPFHYFALGEVFKSEWGSKILLDFRDPFAYNPRFNFTEEQRDFARELESDWVKRADAVVSVNQYCLDTVAPRVEVPRYVVANGFDEAIVDGSLTAVREQHRPMRVAYSGTVFPNLPLGGVLDALPPDRLELHHFGRDYSATQDVAKHPNAVVRGLVPYAELIPDLRECVAGIIMTSGEPSTQTTKLFDYLACDLDIIIVTSGRPRTGNLHEVTKDLKGVFWVKNSDRDLGQFFKRYEPTLPRRPERESFSRRDQTRRLFELIMEMESP